MTIWHEADEVKPPHGQPVHVRVAAMYNERAGVFRCDSGAGFTSPVGGRVLEWCYPPTREEIAEQYEWRDAKLVEAEARTEVAELRAATAEGEVARLMARLAELEEVTRWRPVSEPPDDNLECDVIVSASYIRSNHPHDEPGQWLGDNRLLDLVLQWRPRSPLPPATA